MPMGLVWAMAAILVGVGLWALSTWLSDLIQALAAMWRPIAVTIGAAVFLIVNDQGQELGVGLMNEPGWKLLALFLVLIYWALNNWHSARLGLEDAIELKSGGQPQPLTGRELWLYWPPRLLGVCAHLLAAVSLALAAQTQPAFVKNDMFWLAYAAPLAIGLAAVLFWGVDYIFVSKRNDARPYQRVAWVVLPTCVVAEVCLLVFMIIALSEDRIPTGFFWGTLWISASAGAFLILISVLRRGKPTATNETRRQTVWTLSLFAPVLAASIASVFFPMQIGRAFGSMIICFFAFGAVLASVTFFSLATRWTAALLRQRWPGATQRGVSAFALTFLLALALCTSLIRPFHRVRLCEEKDACPSAYAPMQASDWSAIKEPAGRPTVAQAAQEWFDQAREAYGPSHPGKPVPMLIVATAGGGIRAAVWTAAVFERLERDLDRPDSPGGLRHLLFAVSAVSGGSVGAAAYIAATAAHEHDAAKPVAPVNYLGEDFLAPGLVSWIFTDGPSNFLPDWGQGDRGLALEKGFEDASDGLLGAAFLSFFPDATAARSHWRPILLLNATHQETGRRIITSNVKIERHVFQDSYDALQILGADVRASTAAHNSARFTYVSPAGNLIPAGNKTNRGYIIDGGYFDNYGAATALEISREAERAIKEKYGENSVRRVILLISSDPTLDGDRARVRLRESDGDKTCVLSTAAPANPGAAGAGNYFPFQDAGRDASGAWASNDGEGVVFSYYNEITAPLFGVMSVREAHGTRAAEELAAEICSEQPSPNAERRASNQQEKIAANLAAAADAPLSSTHPLPARGDRSFFAHLAMCGADGDDRPTVKPPLGWVLSNDTREKMSDFLDHCDNRNERVALETALGLAEPK